MKLEFFPLQGEVDATELWQRCLEGINPQYTFGPEVPDRRPRVNEECFEVKGDDVTIGMWGLRWPTPTTAHVWAALLPEHRGKGWSKHLQYARLSYLFGQRGAKKVEYGVYTSNEHSLHVSKQSKTMKVEGLLQDNIEVDGIMYDCLLFGITLPEWRKISGDPK